MCKVYVAPCSCRAIDLLVCGQTCHSKGSCLSSHPISPHVVRLEFTKCIVGCPTACVQLTWANCFVQTLLHSCLGAVAAWDRFYIVAVMTRMWCCRSIPHSPVLQSPYISIGLLATSTAKFLWEVRVANIARDQCPKFGRCFHLVCSLPLVSPIMLDHACPSSSF